MVRGNKLDIGRPVHDCNTDYISTTNLNRVDKETSCNMLKMSLFKIIFKAILSYVKTKFRIFVEYFNMQFFVF